jgi:outer membrane protein assembly factor BamA
LIYNPDITNPEQKSSAIRSLGFYTQRSQWLVSGETEWFFDVDRYNFIFSADVSRYPSYFYGIGPETDLSDEESYTPFSFELTTAFRFKIVSDLYLGPRVIFTTTDILEVEDGGILDAGDIPGSNGTTYLGGGPHLTLDKRDNATFPLRGFMVDITLDFLRKELGCCENYTQFALDYRHFFQLYREHVLGVHFYTQMNSGTTPFQVLPSLGGMDLMRGYRDDRYRDNISAVAQIEYRFPVFWRLGGVVFGGIGQVAHSLSEFSFNDLKYAGGIGIRFTLTNDPKLNLRFDFALSPESYRFYITALEAF